MPIHIEPGPRFTEAVVADNFVFLSGQVPAPEAKNGDIKEQTKSVLDQIDMYLAKAGSDKSRVVSATCYLRNIADYAGMNEVWDAWIADGDAAGNKASLKRPAPARATVQAMMADSTWRVEIVVVAARKPTRVEHVFERLNKAALGGMVGMVFVALHHFLTH